MLTGAQGEDVGLIQERAGNVTHVFPFSWSEYFRVLHNRVTDGHPEAVVCEEPTEQGVVLFVENRIWDEIVNRVKQRRFLKRNVAYIRHFDTRRWNMAQERMHADPDLWFVLNSDPPVSTNH